MNKTYFTILTILLGAAVIGAGFLMLQNKKTEQEPQVRYLENSSVKESFSEEKEINLLNLAKKIAGFDKEMSYLVLFQNNLELRPTGGFVSSFATVKVEKAQLKEFKFYDTAVFDLELSTFTQITPPEPINKYLWVKNWQFRDGNWSPNFPTSAEKMIELYHLQGGQEEFDGVIAITPEVLKSLLKIHGPIQLPEYDLTINEDNFLLTLEQHIEIDYQKKGIKRFDRKNVLKDIAQILIQKTTSENPLKMLGMIDLAEKHLNQKDILLYFKDPELQKDIETMNWGGRVREFKKDYLMIVDSNINSFKADYFVERQFKYEVDLSKDKPTVKLTISYNHTAQEKSWLTRDYNNWLRVYVPKGSWFTNIEGLSTEPQYGEAFNKTFVAGLAEVLVGNQGQVILEYELPENVKNTPYELLVQKQPGINELPVEINLINENNSRKTFQEVIKTDKIFKF